jgi:hypothetical protein
MNNINTLKVKQSSVTNESQNRTNVKPALIFTFRWARKVNQDKMKMRLQMKNSSNSRKKTRGNKLAQIYMIDLRKSRPRGNSMMAAGISQNMITLQSRKS